MRLDGKIVLSGIVAGVAAFAINELVIRPYLEQHYGKTS